MSTKEVVSVDSWYNGTKPLWDCVFFCVFLFVVFALISGSSSQLWSWIVNLTRWSRIGVFSPSVHLLTLIVFNRNVLLSLQLQSNLIPGLNLNALGLFPSGAPGMGPSMSSVPPPGAHGGCSSFGVSLHSCHQVQLFAINSTCTFPRLAVLFRVDILQFLGQMTEKHNSLKKEISL